MGNTNSVFGARLVGHLQGSPFDARIRPYTVLASDGKALFAGDFVIVVGTAEASEEGFTLPVVTQAIGTEGTPSARLVGVVMGFLPTGDYLNQTYRTASTLRTALVCDDPYALYEIQANGTVAAGDINSNADIVVAAGDTTWGSSGMQLDISSVAPTSAHLRIMGLAQRTNNDLGAYAKLITMINEHEYKGTTGT